MVASSVHKSAPRLGRINCSSPNGEARWGTIKISSYKISTFHFSIFHSKHTCNNAFTHLPLVQHNSNYVAREITKQIRYRLTKNVIINKNNFLYFTGSRFEFCKFLLCNNFRNSVINSSLYCIFSNSYCIFNSVSFASAVRNNGNTFNT